MARLITQEDIMLILQGSQDIKIRVEILDQFTKKLVGIIEGLVSGTMSIDGDSDIRRTASIAIQPTLTKNIKLNENSLLWLNKEVRLSVGLYNLWKQEYKYYPLGEYIYTDTTSTYDAVTNQLTVNLADHMVKLDGSKNGQLGSLIIKFPAYEENTDTGEPISYNIIRNAVIEVLQTLAGITKHRIDDIGEHYAMPENSQDWATYRQNNPLWNTIPFDQEFSAGCSVLSILTTFRDLYPGYEMLFDMEDNTFICQLIPTCYDDDIFLDNDVLQKAFISENTSTDMITVRNICEVWGQVIETDFYSESVSYTGNVYSSTIEGYEEQYYNGDKIGLKIPIANLASASININGFGSVGIYDESNEQPIEADRLKANNVYVFKIKKKHENGTDVTKAYLLGQWQVHALDVLTDGTIGEKVTASDGTQWDLYSKEYFQKFFNCESVVFHVVPDSPFTVQKIGMILDVKTGGEYENITSDDLAIDRARWENWKNCRLTDSITLTTSLLPFMDVNKKISYKSHDSDEVRQYIVKSVSHDFSGFTTTLSMYRFYPLYIPSDDEQTENTGTYDILSDLTYEQLSNYTYGQLSTMPERRINN